jgi:ferredoxin
MAKVCIYPLDIHLQTLDQETLLDSLKRAKVVLEAICGGKGYCGTCLVQIIGGQSQLTPVTEQEMRILENLGKSSQDYRLSCQVKVNNGMEVSCQLPTPALVKLVQIFERLKNRYAPRDILHPTSGELLVPQGGVVTQAVLEKLLSA